MTFTDDQIRHMVNRFLGWRLPDPWHPDGGIEFKPEFNVEYMASQGKPPMRHEPTGTNLFDYKQSTAMVRYMVEGMERAGDAALARVQAAAPGEREADPLDGLPIERENMLAERQRLLDRKFAGDMTSGEATRLAFVRYGLDVWEEATRTPSPEAAPGAEAKVRALDEALRKLESKWRREGENMVFSKHRRDAMKGCADALAALIGGDNG